MRETDNFVLFWDGPFSQWHPSIFKDSDGLTFCCAEQYMMYHKAMYFEDDVIAEKIMETKNPKAQKVLGRQVQDFDPKQWDEVCDEIVCRGNYLKFTQNKDLLDILMATGRKTLVEASPYDRIWGIGLAEDDVKCEFKETWRGLNKLGYALTKLRDFLICPTPELECDICQDCCNEGESIPRRKI